jgi:hypothetical protein
MPLARVTIAVVVVSIASIAVPVARQAAPGALARMPIKEVSIFKDGHAFVMHEGTMPVDGSGRVVMDYLPSPVLGTFWAYTTDPSLKVASATAGRHRVTISRTALELEDLLRANAGADVIVTEKPSGSPRDAVPYDATILALPRRTSEELLATSPPNTPESLPVEGRIILLRTAAGVKVLPLDRIQDVVFKAAPEMRVAQDEFRNVLSLRLAGSARTPGPHAPVGVVYVQKGLRWIPSYRVAIDGRGRAVVQLQALVVNELADLENVAANLVVGVPSFAFKDTLDPLAPAAVPLSSYFQEANRSALSNAIASQVAARPGEGAAAAANPIPEFDSASRAEDLFLYALKGVSLRKGERLSVPVSERALGYTDLYTLDVPFTPPPEVHVTRSMDAQAELAHALSEPRPLHKIRLANTGDAPLTTAPALVVQDGRVLSQGLVSYTPAGGSGDLEIGKAVDVQVVRAETESARTPNVVRINGDTYSEVRITGSIALTNFRKEAIQVEVTRHVLGRPIAATAGGRVDTLSALTSSPEWWRHYAWPSWWWLANGQGRMRWSVRLEPGQRVELGYEWGYYWR